MSTIVISQPLLFPWVGLFEQIRLADVFVHYDDVAFSKGSFINRVQLKSPRGSEWMTVPLKTRHLGDRILDLVANDEQNWRHQHLSRLEQYYRDAPFCRDMLEIVQCLYSQPGLGLSEILIQALHAVCAYWDLATHTQFFRSSELAIPGRNSPRVLEIVKRFGGKTYVTGHGAKNYLDHEAFEAEGIEVRYMDYQRRPYPQLHGAFDPHVSILDLIANCGPDGVQYICSSTVSWRDFLGRQRAAS